MLAVTSVVVLSLDLIWLKSIRWFSEREMGGMLLAEPRMVPATVFYIALFVEITFFVVAPNVGAGTMTTPQRSDQKEGSG